MYSEISLNGNGYSDRNERLVNYVYFYWGLNKARRATAGVSITVNKKRKNMKQNGMKLELWDRIVMAILNSSREKCKIFMT